MGESAAGGQLLRIPAMLNIIADELGGLRLGDRVSIPLAAGGRDEGELIAYRGSNLRRTLVVKLDDGTVVPAPLDRCRAAGGDRS